MQNQDRTSMAAEGNKRRSGLQFSKVLAPVDFSESSLASLRLAVQFASQQNSRLVLLHVVEPMACPAVAGVNFNVIPMSAIREPTRLSLSRWKESEVPAGIQVDVKLRIGRAYHEITEAARELNADLIVISTHGYTGFKHVLFGSTADRVVRHSPCLVLTIRSRLLKED